MRASRKNGNRQPHEVRGWGDLPECTRDLGDEPDSRERELVEPTSSRKTGNQVTDGVATLQSKL